VAGTRRALASAWLLSATAVALAVSLAGCGGGAAQEGVSLQVAPRISLADQPLRIVVRGLHPGERVTLGLESTDVHGVTWTSSATFTSDSSGLLDVSRAAPISGSYTGVSPMGLVWSMHSPHQPAAEAYFWRFGSPLTWTATASAGGDTVATARFVRRFSAIPIVARSATLSADGFVGKLFAPASRARRPAILLIGGSEGGISSPLEAGALAAQGYPTLTIAYFKYPGLPSTLSRIPLEYFARALAWLARQPGVDPAHVLTLGVSRGSEAALLLGVHYPSLVHGVIALVPSDAAICSYPGCRGPAWMLGGRPLPYTRQFDDPAPTGDPAAVIPVERIRGPVLLDCGGEDQTWVSCPYASAIMSRLAAHRDHFAHVEYAYAAAGHGIGDFVPYEPEGTADALADATFVADQHARIELWPRLLAFLEAGRG
jgi:dienelactone hydrolase